MILLHNITELIDKIMNGSRREVFGLREKMTRLYIISIIVSVYTYIPFPGMNGHTYLPTHYYQY